MGTPVIDTFARRSLARSACAECPQAQPRAFLAECPRAQPHPSRSGHPRREPHANAPIQWSGKRDSNPRPPVWRAGALRRSYARLDRWWGGEDLSPRRRTPADLQSAPFGHLGTSPNLPACDENPSSAKTRHTSWRWREDLNPRPTAYKAVALPLSYASTEKVPIYCRGPEKSSTSMALAGDR